MLNRTAIGVTVSGLLSVSWLVVTGESRTVLGSPHSCLQCKA